MPTSTPDGRSCRRATVDVADEWQRANKYVSVCPRDAPCPVTLLEGDVSIVPTISGYVTTACEGQSAGSAAYGNARAGRRQVVGRGPQHSRPQCEYFVSNTMLYKERPATSARGAMAMKVDVAMRTRRMNGKPPSRTMAPGLGSRARAQQ